MAAINIAAEGEERRPPAGTRAATDSTTATGTRSAGAGVAVAALGSALAYIAKTLQQASATAIVCSILGAVLLVILPTSILAVLKLRRRDLSAILEGSGWGINARMRLTRRLGRFFTQRPDYPGNSRGLPKHGLRLLGIVALVVIILGSGAWVWRATRSTPEAEDVAPTSKPAGPVSAPPEAPPTP